MASSQISQQQFTTFRPVSPTTPRAEFDQPLTRRSTTSSTISDAPSLTTSLTSGATTPQTTPIPTTIYQIRKRILSGPQSKLPDQILSTHKCLEEANNSVYAMRLAYETCDPCFFWYGDGHGSVHPDLVDPATVKQASNEEKPDCLSWEVFVDEDCDEDVEDREMGCRVWVERVEQDLWGAEDEESLNLRIGSENDQELSVGKKVHNWREALEPITKPCDFWGTFTVKCGEKRGSV